jgi:hypothetical protein
MEWLGWLLAVGLGVGWWIDHRGAAGIKSDLADARRELQSRVKR